MSNSYSLDEIKSTLKKWLEGKLSNSYIHEYGSDGWYYYAEGKGKFHEDKESKFCKSLLGDMGAQFGISGLGEKNNKEFLIRYVKETLRKIGDFTS